jgi:hypothetical protein
MQAQSNATIVIVAYRAKPGMEADLLQLTRQHVPLLRAEGLATDRPVTACQARDGTVVEVFEWVVGGAERAHSNPTVLKLCEFSAGVRRSETVPLGDPIMPVFDSLLWERYGAACDIAPLASLPEVSTMFASFTPLNL